MEHPRNYTSLNGKRSLRPISIGLFLVFSAVSLIAQSEKDDQEVLRLRQNVVKVEAVRKSGGIENGFGFVVGEKNGSLYIVTAYHVVGSEDEVEDKNPQVSVTFYTDQGKAYPAEVLATHKPRPHDLAVLRVQAPPGFEMETYCLPDSGKEKRATPVWSIGKLGNWRVQGVPGAVGEGPNSDQIIALDQMGVIPGCSGGPVVASTGIIGILLTDSAENTRALGIDYIKAAFAEWNYPWSLDKYDRAKLDAADARKLESRSPGVPPAASDSPRPTGPTTPSRSHRCGVERWAIKTGTDDDARNVDLEHPINSSITRLISLAAPNPLPLNNRFAPVENTVFTVQAILREYKVEADSDYHLILEDDSGRTMVAEIPSPNCVGAGSPFTAQIASARASLEAKLSAASSLQTANIPVEITGVGFFDFHHGQAGVAPNAIELHPVLKLVFNPQSPTGTDFTFSLSPAVANVIQGGNVSTTISTESGNASNSKASFTPSNLPFGVTSTVTSSAAGKTIMTFIASSTAKTGTFPVVVTGTSGQKAHTETLSLSVMPSLPSDQGASQWEYNFVIAKTEQDVVERANILATQRWEVIGVVRNQSDAGYVVFFKRTRRDH